MKNSIANWFVFRPPSHSNIFSESLKLINIIFLSKGYLFKIKEIKEEKIKGKK